MQQSLDLNSAEFALTLTPAAPTPAAAAANNMATTHTNASPPDFDFSLPCRYFKSSFARSLSLTNASNQCKSLDFDINSQQRNNCSSNSCNSGSNSNCHHFGTYMKNISLEAPPELPQRLSRPATATIMPSNMMPSQFNELNCQQHQHVAAHITNDMVNLNTMSSLASTCSTPPPALPARRTSINNFPIQQQQQQQQQSPQPLVTQFRQTSGGGAAAASNATNKPHFLPENFNKAINNHKQPQQQQQQSQLTHQPSTHCPGNSCINNNNNNSNTNHINSNFIRRNIWPTASSATASVTAANNIIEQDYNLCDEAEHQQHDSNKLTATLDYATAANNAANATSAMTAAATATMEQQRAPLSLTLPALPTLSTSPTTTAVAAAVAVATAATPTTTAFEVHDNAMNVEAVILQNQVDTLQWQLKQVETSCEMYRAVMEEVARFLDRYHNQKQQQRQQQSRNNNLEQISRSKSLYHVYGGGGHEKAPPVGAGVAGGGGVIGETSSTAYLRARSSTNLVDLKQTTASATQVATVNNSNNSNGKLSAAAAAAGMSVDDHSYDVIAPANSYTTFKDFTWRRSPKKQSDCKAHALITDADEKLNQEAFRLSRTIHNLLNTSTQQPDLTQHRNSLAAVSMNRLCKTPTTSIMTLHNAGITNATNNNNNNSSNHNGTDSSATLSNCSTASTKSSGGTLASEMLFLRSANMRDSRLSLRSSTDSSVHSTTSSSAASSSSSSKVETDEEHHMPFQHSTPPAATALNMLNKQIAALGSTTEDESGFSSISSFQDVGLPLSSTLLSTSSITGRHLGCQNSTAECSSSNSSSSNANDTNSLLDYNISDSRHATLKALPATPTATSAPCSLTHPSNVVGVPLNATHDMQHRWDSPATKTYRNATKYQRFSTLANEDATAVLWV